MTDEGLIGGVVGFLAAAAGSVLALAAGMPWERLLHWGGESLVLLGICLAAKGISDVRRTWTALPGLAAWVRAGVLVVARWTLSVAGRAIPGFSGDLPGIVLIPAGFSGLVTTFFAPDAAADDERIARLEQELLAAAARITALEAALQQESGELAAATSQERAEREAADQRTREEMAAYIAGGLRLQAWGVAFLLAGTILTAFY